MADDEGGGLDDRFDITVSVEAGDWSEEDEALCGKVARATLTGVDDVPDAPMVELSLVLADDDTVQALNRDYRGKDKPTNVLSFAFSDHDDGIAPPPDAPLMLGDVIIARETVAREAEAQKKSFAAHLSHLVAHGVLHLLGYDHVEESDAQRMERTEVFILARLGLSDPYADG